MDLHSPQNFWPLKNGLLQNLPSLQKNLKTDVVIIGAGVTGALVANALCDRGERVIIVDKRHCAHGSTAASTALLQYEIDKPLHQLIKLTDLDTALRSYRLCLKAILDLEKISKKIPIDPHFKFKPSFQFASAISHLPKLEEEFKLRKKHQISKVDFLDEVDIKKKYGFSKPAGLLSRDGAEVDPFRLTHGLIKKHDQHSLQVFDNTTVVDIIHHLKSVEIKTNTGYTIKAKKLVIACGYESQNYLPKKVEILHSTYAIVSEVVNQKNLWYKNSLIWETAMPYLYIRTTADNRILVGGKDDAFSNPIKRDQRLPAKARGLEKSFQKLFPKINFRKDYQWAGTFCETKDGLPYIGSIPQRLNTYFALGFGGNGITFSLVAADIITDLISGRQNEDAKLFSFTR
jgi:glycine/D-amino acid oxidase-like deaminating enzyme